MLQYFTREEKAKLLRWTFLHFFYFVMAMSQAGAMHLAHSERIFFQN